MASRETEDDGYAKFWGEHYGMLWYFLEWSILTANRVHYGGFEVGEHGTSDENLNGCCVTTKIGPVV